MKNKQKFKIILLILILIILYLVIRNTYSKYITSESSSSTLNISKWHILLNDKDISENTDFSSDIEIDYIPNENIANGVIVPTSKGSFSIDLESTGTELPFEYEISINQDSSSIIDYKIISYSLDNGTTITELSSDETSIKGEVIPPTDTDGNFTGEEVKNTFFIYVEWFDGNETVSDVLDNANDVAVSKITDSKGIINLNLKVTQIQK